jgi:DNA (cytosine-5)-methyltransferase 1
LDQQYGNGIAASTEKPAGTITNVPKMNLVQTQFIMDTQFNNIGHSLDELGATITSNRKWHYLMNPQYLNAGGDIEKPCFTLIARMDKMPPYLVQVEGGMIAIEVYSTDTEIMRKIKYFMAMYGIASIKMRMLKVIELKRIQGFPENYILKGNQADQKKFIGNSVQPHVMKCWVLSMAARERLAAACA